jgi:hypothetical protein
MPRAWIHAVAWSLDREAFTVGTGGALTRGVPKVADYHAEPLSRLNSAPLRGQAAHDSASHALPR